MLKQPWRRFSTQTFKCCLAGGCFSSTFYCVKRKDIQMFRRSLRKLPSNSISHIVVKTIRIRRAALKPWINQTDIQVMLPDFMKVPTMFYYLHFRLFTWFVTQEVASTLAKSSQIEIMMILGILQENFAPTSLRI